MRVWEPAYVGIGSNLDDPQAQVRAAIDALGELDATRLVAVSRLYQTPPWGDQDQPDFVNAAVGLLAANNPRPLLQALQQIERARGRDRSSGRRWGPRTLDLDLIAFGARALDEPGLTIPHPRAKDRAFVLAPLADIAADLWLPGYGRVRNLLKVVETDGLNLLAAES